MTDRDQVAREEKATLLREFCGFISGDIPELHHVEVPRIGESVERFLNASAPAAPVTVTVDGLTWTYMRDGDYWRTNWPRNPNCETRKAYAMDARFLDRIAADAQRIAELEKSLAHQTDMANQADVACSIATRERDEARRALEDFNALAQLEAATSQGEGLGAPASTSDEAPNSEVTGGGIAAASPAPIPLGAPRRWWLNCYADLEAVTYKSEEAADRWADRSDPTFRRVVVVEAVATRETVERVATLLERRCWSALTWEERAAEILRALGYTIQEGEA